VDVGTGSGAWVIEVADQYTRTQVFGTDLSPIQPRDVPENAEFIVGDFTYGLDFDDGSTDVVQSRLVNLILSLNVGWSTMGFVMNSGLRSCRRSCVYSNLEQGGLSALS
jgi:hypothetical protein